MAYILEPSRFSPHLPHGVIHSFSTNTYVLPCFVTYALPRSMEFRHWQMQHAIHAQFPDPPPLTSQILPSGGPNVQRLASSCTWCGRALCSVVDILGMLCGVTLPLDPLLLLLSYMEDIEGDTCTKLFLTCALILCEKGNCFAMEIH